MKLQSMISTLSRAMLARMLFAAHSIIAISQMVEVYGHTSYWGFTLITCSILIEGLITILQREGQEHKWYLQIDLSEKKLAAHRNGTTYAELEKMQSMKKTALEMHFKVSHELWIQMLEQTLLVVLIVGRWLLPKGDITREQLSQILLAYLAIASDIVELFDVFKEDQVNHSAYLPKMVLTVWTLSVLQFPLVLTTSKARKMRVALTTSTSDEEIKRLQYMADCEAKSRPKWVQALGDVDIWAIVVACLLQDLPFLTVRAYLMLVHGLMSYTMIFFTAKNVLVILLQLYRLMVIIHERYRSAKIEEDAKRLTQHYRQMLHACKDVLTKLKDEGTSHVQNIASHHRSRQKKTGGQGGKKQKSTGASTSGSAKRVPPRKFEDILETDESAISPKADKRNDVVLVVTDETTAGIKAILDTRKRKQSASKSADSSQDMESKDEEPTAIVHKRKSPSPSNRSPVVEDSKSPSIGQQQLDPFIHIGHAGRQTPSPIKEMQNGTALSPGSK